VTFEDKKRENFERGNLELEKRRQALLELQRKEQERLATIEREEQERRVRPPFKIKAQRYYHRSFVCPLSPGTMLSATELKCHYIHIYCIFIVISIFVELLCKVHECKVHKLVSIGMYLAEKNKKGIELDVFLLGARADGAGEATTA